MIGASDPDTHDDGHAVVTAIAIRRDRCPFEKVWERKIAGP
jgi:hypothetical protein